MILFTNLENVLADGHKFKPIPILKLTTDNEFNTSLLNSSKKQFLDLLKKEAEINGFRIKINDTFFV
jgi:hypothetical protein